MARAPLGIQRLYALEINVRDAAPWLAYLARGLGFQHVGRSTDATVEQTGTRRHLLACGGLRLVLAEAVHAGSDVRRYLEKHPEGIGRVHFVVADIRRAEQQLLERNATLIDAVQTETITGGEWSSLAIATPLGDVEYVFAEISGADDAVPPGMEQVAPFDPSGNPLGLSGIDHLTANTRTMMPVIAFHEHVLGFARCWDVSFHPEDIHPGVGGGLKSVAMADETGRTRLAINEPLRPRFAESQVQLHVDTNRGPGIQHVALGVGDLFGAVEAARQNGVQFMATPREYYDVLPARLANQGVGNVAHNMADIRRLELLVDGDKSGYLLQSFCQDQSIQFGRPQSGPLFIELIQRCGCQRFGEGNFRALFEAARRRDGQAPSNRQASCEAREPGSGPIRVFE